MKKITLFLAIAMMCIAFMCGCAAQPASQPAEQTPASTQEQEAQKTPDAPEETPAPAELPGEELLGDWFDSASQRASMTVAREGEGFSVVIRWADSAFETNEWRMTGVYEDTEDGRIVSEDCALYHLTYSDEDTFEEELVYENGGAQITYVNGMLYWFDKQEDIGDECMFERVEKHVDIPAEIGEALKLPVELSHPGDVMVGEWQNSWSQRASMTVLRDGEFFTVEIRWADSAFETNEWQMTGVYEDVEGGRIVSNDCALYHTTFDEDGNMDQELVYEDGSAEITYVNGMLYWNDKQEDAGDECMFEFISGPTMLPSEGEELLGKWIDTDSQRATMNVEWTGTRFYVVIHWADSAFEATQWRMYGTYEDVEDGRIVAERCDRYTVTAGDGDLDGVPYTYEEQEYQATTENVKITYVNGMLYWFDAEDTTGENCMFERME